MAATPLAGRRTPEELALELGLDIRALDPALLVTVESADDGDMPMLVVFTATSAFLCVPLLLRPLGTDEGPGMRGVLAVPPAFAVGGDAQIVGELALACGPPGDLEVAETRCPVLFLDAPPSLLARCRILETFPESFDQLACFGDGMDDVVPTVDALRGALEIAIQQNWGGFCGYETGMDDWLEEAGLPPLPLRQPSRAAPRPSAAPAAAKRQARGGRGGGGEAPKRAVTGNAAVLAELAAMRAEIIELRAVQAAPSRPAQGGGRARVPDAADGSGLGVGRSNPAADALARAREVLGENADAPAPEPIGRSARQQDELLQDLLRQASRGDEGSGQAMQLANTMLLERLSARFDGRGRASDADEDDAALFGLGSSGDNFDGASVGVSLRGSEGISRINANIRRYPGRWWRAFDRSVQESSFSHVTGLPWSLYGYARENVRFDHQQEDLEHATAIITALHALHRKGPEAYDELGAAISQGFKACEQAARDKDWTLAWLWTGLPPPRPQGRFTRGLAHPAEHAAGLAYLKEIKTLQEHREQVRGGAHGGGYGPHRPPPNTYVDPDKGKGKGKDKGKDKNNGGGAAADAAATGEGDGGGDAPRGGRRRGRGRGDGH